MTFTWRRTFPETRHDFVAAVDGQDVGRILKRDVPGLRRAVWFWTAFGLLPCTGEIAPLNGEVATRDEAIAALTAAYGRAKIWGERAGRAFVMPPPAERRPIADP